MQIAEPNVTMIAHTGATIAEGFPIEPNAAGWLEPQEGSSVAEYITEFAGRACYQSFNRPNPATAKTEDYIQRTLFEQGHWSIAEHVSVTFYITGVSRAFTHELIRHRHLSCSQLSQRFVNEEEAKIVMPPAIKCGSEKVALYNVMNTALKGYSEIVENLTDEHGLGRKQAREAARAVLPNMTETKIVVTGNLRAWHEFCERRMQPDADAEIQLIAGMIYEQLGEYAPTIFPDKHDDDEAEEEDSGLVDSAITVREGMLLDMKSDSIVKAGGDMFIRRYFGWENLTTGAKLISFDVATLGEYEVIYKED